MRLNFGWTLALLMLITTPKVAHASFQLTGRGVASFSGENYNGISQPSIGFGADGTYGMSDLFQLGFTYNKNSLNYSQSSWTVGGNGTVVFYGAISRFGFIGTSLFVDLQAGLCARDSLPSSFSWGVAAGYKFPISYMVSLSPRVSYRSLPDSSVTRALIDAGLMLTLSFL